MKKNYIIFLLILMVLRMSVFSVGTTANSPFEETATAVIIGRVVDEQGNGLPGAGIVVRELNMGTVAGQGGQFEIKNLRPGIYTIQVLHLGYVSQSKVVNVDSEQVRVDFIMTATHIELREVIVQESATGVVNPEKSLNVTVAGGDYFSSSSSVTLIQSLQRIPGVTSMDIGASMSKPMLRGLGFNRLVVAQNNIKQQGQQWGNDHGLEIDPYDVDRVEIVKGPSSLIYGSDAIGGAINIRPAVVPQENTLGTEVVGVAQSNNALLGGSVMAAVSRAGFFFRSRFSHQDYGDYHVPARQVEYNSWVMPLPGGRLVNTSGHDYGFSTTAGLRGAWGVTSVTLSNYRQLSGFFPASHGVPDPVSILQWPASRNPLFPRQYVNHLRIVSNSSIILNKQRLEVDFGFQQNHRQELNPPHSDGGAPVADSNLELELILNTFSAGVKYFHNLTSRSSFLLGVEGSSRQNTRGGYSFLLPGYRYHEGGIYGIFNRKAGERLFINAGTRVDASLTYIDAYPSEAGQGISTPGMSGSAALDRSYLNIAFSTGLSWLPSEAINIKLNAGSSFRNPTPVELSSNGIHHGSFRHEMGDSALQPERAWQLDAGFTFQATDVYIHLSPFVNYFSNFLFLNPTGRFSPLAGGGQIYRFQQATALHLGGEWYADWHVTHELHTSVGSSWVWAQNLDDNYPVPFTPPATVTAEVNYTFEQWDNPGLRLISSVRTAAPQRRVARNEPSTQGYTVVNTGLKANFQAYRVPIEILFMVNNIFDTRYYNHVSFYRILELPEPGRNFTLKIVFSS